MFWQLGASRGTFRGTSHGAARGTSRDVPTIKTIDSLMCQLKKSAIFLRVFPARKIVDLVNVLSLGGFS